MSVTIGCACFCVTFSFTKEISALRIPGHLTAKVYYDQRSISLRSRQDLLDQSTLHLKQLYLYNPSFGRCGCGSLLDFDTEFEENDGRLRCLILTGFRCGSLPIVMVQVINKLQNGRIVRVTASGTHPSQLEGWQPIWTCGVENCDSFPGHSGGIVTNMYAPMVNDCEFAECRSLCFEIEILVAEDPYQHQSVLADIHHMMAFDSSTLITLPLKKTAMNIAEHNGKPPKFPVEVWLHIINKLDDKLLALVALSGTCQEWRQLFAHPCFYSTVDLKSIAVKWHLASPYFASFLNQRCHKIVKHLRVSWLPSLTCSNLSLALLNHVEPGILTTFVAEYCYPLGDSAIGWLAENQPNLRKLKLARCPNVTGIGLQQIGRLPQLRGLSLVQLNDVTLDALETIANKCDKLEALEFSVNKLHGLGIVEAHEKISQIMQQLFRKCANTLRALKLHVFVGAPSLVLSICPKLEEFYTHHDCGDLIETLTNRNWPNLRRLEHIFFDSFEILKSSQPLETSVATWLSGCQNLEQLAISFLGSGIFSFDLCLFLGHLPKLRHLFILWDVVNAETVLESARQRFPNCLIEAAKWSMPGVIVEPCKNCPLGPDLCPDRTNNPEKP